eukprot:1599127-Pyramimonas_sp.AAC.1
MRRSRPQRRPLRSTPLRHGPKGAPPPIRGNAPCVPRGNPDDLQPCPYGGFQDDLRTLQEASEDSQMRIIREGTNGSLQS